MNIRQYVAKIIPHLETASPEAPVFGLALCCRVQVRAQVAGETSEWLRQFGDWEIVNEFPTDEEVDSLVQTVKKNKT